MLTVVALAAVCIPHAAAWAAGDRIVEVRVRGNRQMSTNAVLQHVSTRAGGAYDETLVRADEQRLLKTGRFQKVEAVKTETPQGVIVTFTVIERGLVGKISFVGNKAFKDAELQKELPFSLQAPLTRRNATAGMQAIVNKYKSEGYGAVKVSVDIEAFKGQRVLYRIVEGPKITVTSLRFRGNSHFGSFDLRMKVEASARLWPFIAGRLNAEQIERDVHTLRNLYVDEGFLDVQVARQLDYSADKKSIVLTFVIEEGLRYRIHNVTFKGNEAFSGAELARGLRLREGQFFTAEYRKLDLKGLQAKYGRFGYINARVTPQRLFVKDRAGLVDLLVVVDEGQPFTVGKVSIRGNTITKDAKIRNTVKLVPGQILDTTALERSQLRLMETGLFEDVKVSIFGEGARTRSLLVDIKEGRTAQFLVGAGISSREGLLGTVSFRQRNFDILGWPRSWGDLFSSTAFKGAGQTFSIVAEPGTDLMRFRVEWYDPALADSEYSLGVKAYVFTTGRETYDEMRWGPVVSVGRMFRNRWYGEGSVRLEGITIDGLSTTAPPQVMSDAGDHILVFFKGALAKDRTDSRWLPSEGDRFRASYEQAVGSYNFGRVNTSYAIFHTLHEDTLDRKHILASRGSLGYIVGDAPVFEKFYGGGIGSIRGFRYRGISPRAAGTNKQIGGDFTLFLGTEYSFPLVERNLRGVVFLDTGTVSKDFGIDTYRVAVGVGLRWRVPMMGPVPMTFNFAFPLVKGAGDDTEVFSFSIGWLW